MLITQARDRRDSTPTDRVMIHCQRCWKRRPHIRTIHGGLEILTCVVCGEEQHYRYTGPQPEE